MSSTLHEVKSAIIPCLRYRDAPAAIEWLCQTFGFRKQMVVAHEDGTIAHAQLTFGEASMIMVASVTPSEFARMLKQPDELGGFETQAPYVLVDDADAIYARARAAGATIEIDIKDENHGGRSFVCRDPEGHVWSFGTFNPWG